MKEKIMIRRISDGGIREKEDDVALEEQFDIILQNRQKVSVVCTPACVDEMILGRRFLLGDVTEEELAQIRRSKEEKAHEKVLMEVHLEEIFRIARDFFENPGPLFVKTGCAHSCALVYQGQVVCCIEDIGRHNALDKVVGYALLHDIPMENAYIFSSGRISEDYLQKAVAAGFRMVVSRAAVTKSAVMLARKTDVTILGFIRKNTGNIYHEGMVSLRP